MQHYGRLACRYFCVPLMTTFSCQQSKPPQGKVDSELARLRTFVKNYRQRTTETLKQSPRGAVLKTVFAFEMDSTDNFDTLSLYPFIVQPIKDIPHCVDILRLERGITEFTESFNGDFI